MSPGPIPHTLSPYLCIEFVNSRFTDHTGSGVVYDRLDMPEWRGWFTRRCGIAVGEPPGAARAELVELRRLLRRLLESRHGPDAAEVAELDRHLARSPYRRTLSLEDGQLSLGVRWERADWHAVMAAVAASYCDLVVGGQLARVRRCANPDCSWLFLDESRNGSRRWCDAAACGNLLAVRRHRRRAA